MSPSRTPAARRMYNAACRARQDQNFPYPCDECGLTYRTKGARTSHRKRIHGILPDVQRTGAEANSGTVSKSASQQQAGFQRVRSRIVRGNNVDSSEAWLIFGTLMFGNRAS